MRPVRKGSNNPPYSPETTFTFLGDSGAVVQRVLKRSSAKDIPIQECLEAWLRQVKGEKPMGGSIADQARAIQAIREKVSDLYKLASVKLMDELGPFCSYCETSQSGLLEVEHCVPKSEYPTFAVNWENFLLACSPCNIAKGSNPSRSVVREWLRKAPTNEQDYYDEIRERHYVWADLDQEAFSVMPLEMEFYDTAKSSWINVPLSEAADLSNIEVSASVALREVKANIPGKSGVRVRVIVGAEKASSRAHEVIQLCKLNQDGNPASTFDRRLWNRTRAWFTCLKALKHYMHESNAASKESSWELLLINATACGFYSVWLTLIRFHVPTMAKRFVTDSLSSGYPGTEISKLL